MPTTLIDIADRLARRVRKLRFPKPVSHVYNPLVYARSLHAQYLERYGTGTGKIVLLGMNPGPWGMVQTGVPFGDVGIVKTWLKLDADVGRPTREHAKVPIRGLDSQRSEISGARLWGWAKETYKTPTRFFKQFFIINYCPLAFLVDSGRNFTPDKLPRETRRPLEEICDDALREIVEVLQPRLVIGVGGFAEKRARIALNGTGPTIARILHPSPASPAANRGWAQQAVAQLREIGVDVPRKGAAV